jgi:chitin synthase
MYYQCLKLNKEFEDVRPKPTQDNEETIKTIRCLKRACRLEFLEPNQPLRPGVLSKIKDNCDLLICVSMYNEGPFDVEKTLSGVVKNLEAFKKAKVESSRIACIVICDGLKPFLETYAKNEGFYKEFIDIEIIEGHYNVDSYKDIHLPNSGDTEIAHCFETDRRMGEHDEASLQLIWVVKEHNKRKLNTHLWFFEGFCEYIQPKFVQLLDVGTQPRRNALYRLYEAMVVDDRIAGCCGEIIPRNPSMWSSIETAQVVEYKFAHIFDKALESLFGYITVLPGAFSAYRWEALQGILCLNIFTLCVVPTRWTVSGLTSISLKTECSAWLLSSRRVLGC